MGIALHYHKIVENEFYGYPEEWFPSVSATIGDRYPERSVFMIFIAITSGPRFALVGLWYLLTRKPGRTLPKAIAFSGILRTLTCGGWTYITSTDDHDWHDIFMISYIVFTIPWTTGCLALSPPNPKAIKYRKYLASAFFGTLVPLIYFYPAQGPQDCRRYACSGGICCASDGRRLTHVDYSVHDLCLLRVVTHPFSMWRLTRLQPWTFKLSKW